MNRTYYIFFPLILIILSNSLFFNCSFKQKDPLIRKIDSIAMVHSNESFDSLYTKVVDSVYNSVEHLNISLNEKSVDSLIQYIKQEGRIGSEHLSNLAPEWAKQLNFNMDTILYPTVFVISESKKQFAVTFDPLLNWECKLYFLSNEKLLASIKIFHKYGLEFTSYVNETGESIFYYPYNFDSGTGIWWFQYFFYKIDEKEIKPVLNQIANSQLSFPWSIRSYQLRSSIICTRPLKIKFKYWQTIYDTTNINGEQPIVNDSTLLKFKWNNNKKLYEADYYNAKLNKLQFSCFQLISDENLFVKAFSQQLKDSLQNSKNRNGIEAFLRNIQ